VPRVSTGDGDDSVLLNPAWHSLIGPHAHLAEGSGKARRYPHDVSPFTAMSDPDDREAWEDLRALVGPGGYGVITGWDGEPPRGWSIVQGGEGVQITGEDVAGVPDEDLLVLTAADVPEMLDLVQRTQPGPFEPRTIELGGYLGIRSDDGRLVAMAGRRLNPPGWVEISAVCTDEEFRGRGYAARLVLAVAHGIRADGLVPLLHAAGSNENAIRVYERLGFRVRRRPSFVLVQADA
jgi:ribosomal protein S18 acetylase RimI-like enzyme